jgi:hypothetical protein
LRKSSFRFSQVAASRVANGESAGEPDLSSITNNARDIAWKKRSDRLHALLEQQSSPVLGHPSNFFFEGALPHGSALKINEKELILPCERVLPRVRRHDKAATHKFKYADQY